MVANTSGSLPRPITIIPGPDGNLWYTTDAGNYIYKMTTKGTTTSYPTTINTKTLIFGPDGNIWINTYNNTQLQKMSMNGSILATYTGLPANGIDSDQMAIGSDKNIWLPNQRSNMIQKSDLNGNITNYLLTGSAQPIAIVAGPDGSLWFTENGTSKVGRLPTSGIGLSEWGNGSNGMSAGAQPWGITVGSDGNIWFTERATNKIGKLVY